MSNFSTWLYTVLFGTLVGNDQFGNRYYESKKPNRTFGRKSRWVVYKGVDEPSKVPPHWFRWLHFQTNEIPHSNSQKHYWEREYLPNLTGSSRAYFPKGNALNGGKRARATGDYEPWKPE